MNFLNKKHVPTFTNTASHFTSQHSNTKSFNVAQQNPHHTTTYISNRIQQNKAPRAKQSPKKMYHNVSSSRLRNEPPQQSSSYSQNFAMKKSPSTSNIPPVNLCPQHDNQILRHLCLQCNQLLCSECISDHLQAHRETTNTIPKIQTINKLKKQMNIKAQKILHFMQQNNPKLVLGDVAQLKFQAISKIHQMKAQVIRVFQQWCKVMQNHVVEDMIKTDELQSLSSQMGKIKEEVLTLYNDMISQQNAPVETIKKVHLIDSEKLQAAYLQMFNKFSKTVLKSKFVFEYNWKHLMQSFEKCLVLKPLHPHVPFAVYENQADMSQPPQKMQRKSSKELINYTTSPVVNTKIHDDDERKFIDIQSIQSLVEPISQLPPAERITIPSSQGNIERQIMQGQKGERSFSRQGSGKRLAIFTAQQQRNSQIESNFVQ